MKHPYVTTLAACATALTIGCSESTHTNSSSITEGGESFAEESFLSSSSYSSRLDIDYKDTLKTNDTLNFYMERAVLKSVKVPKDTLDSTAGDTTISVLKCNDDVVCLDTNQQNLALYLGEYPVGTVISIAVATSGMKHDTLRINNETGSSLKALSPRRDSKKDIDIYESFMLPGDGSNLESNRFVIFEEGYHYLDLAAKFDSSSHMRIVVTVDTAYFGYIGDSTSLKMGIDDTLRGISIIGSSPKSIDVKFKAPPGYSVSLETSGKWINEFALYEKKKLIVQDTTGLDQLLHPQDTTQWTLKVSPLSVENYLTGPYATFEAITTSRKLDKGEYLKHPDSIKTLGDTLTIVRERNDQAKYYLHQEQYIWLADLKKGDSIDVFHEMEGYYSGPSYPATYALLNKNGDSVSTISTYQHGYKATSSGAIYLHYLRKNSPPQYESQELTLRTFIQRPGALDSIVFYDEDNNRAYGDKAYAIGTGDTLWFSNFTFLVYPEKIKASSKTRWFVPCEDLDIIGLAIYQTQQDICRDEQEITSPYVAVQKAAKGGDSARLIAQSQADPKARDTLNIRISK